MRGNNPLVNFLMTTKKHILFVDDEPALLMLSRLIFESEGMWNVSTANSGEAAFTVLKDHPADIIVSDMRMPGMSGADLLTSAMQLYPKASRLIMSAYADSEQIAKALGATHQFIAKPCRPEELVSIVHRVSNLDELLMNDGLKGVISQMSNIPSLPSLYYRILSALGSSESTIEDVARIVAEDPAMTAKTLQLVNSPFFGYSRVISSAHEAVSFLGFACIRTLALSLHLFSKYQQVNVSEFSVRRVWTHSVSTAAAAQKIVRHLGGSRDDATNAYTAGMLHDVGKVMLASEMPEEYAAAIRLATTTGMTMEEAEFEIFGASHAEVGAYLLGLWGLPVPVVEAVAFHHNFREEHLKLLPLVGVHMASAMENIVNGTLENPRPKKIAECIPKPLEEAALAVAREAAEGRGHAKAA